LEPGQPVTFELEQGRKGQEARQLAINDNAPPDLVEKLSAKVKRKQRPSRKPKPRHTGERYIDKQIKEKTPMVFEAYSEPIECIIAADLTYDLKLLCGDETLKIKKLEAKYCLKKRV